MEKKHKKQFGIWMDNVKATVLGRDETNPDQFTILAHIHRPDDIKHSSEHSANNAEKTIQEKFFKEIAHHMQNAEEVHVTGPGKAQEQFIHFMEATPKFKRVKSDQSTTNEMTDDKLLEFISEKFN